MPIESRLKSLYSYFHMLQSFEHDYSTEQVKYYLTTCSAFFNANNFDL